MIHLFLSQTLFFLHHHHKTHNRSCINTYITNLFYTSTTSRAIVPCTNTFITTVFHTSTNTCAIFPYTDTFITGLLHISITSRSFIPYTDITIIGLLFTSTIVCTIIPWTDTFSNAIRPTTVTNDIVLHAPPIRQLDRGDALWAIRTHSRLSTEEGDEVCDQPLSAHEEDVEEEPPAPIVR